MKDANIQFYGERGIVNGILLDIYNDVTTYQDKLNAFFGAIRLLESNDLPWKKPIKECEWLVEPSLAEFGNPDLVVTFRSGGKKFALFIEAKLREYDRCCLEIQKDLKENAFIGKSSRLNVQISFRYRFVKAFFANQQPNMPATCVEESGENQPDKKKRRLHKPIVLNTVNNFLSGVKEDSVYFIALTNDEADKSKWILDECLLPPLSDDAVRKDKQHFGLLTYKALKKAGVISYTGFFATSRRLMIMNLPGDINYIEPKPEEQKQFNIMIRDGFDNSTVWTDIRVEWVELLAAKSCNLRLKKEKGSYSASVQGKVVMKLMADPKNSGNLLLGFNEETGIDIEYIRKAKLENPMKYTINGKPFFCFSFQKEQQGHLIELGSRYMNSKNPEQS